MNKLLYKNLQHFSNKFNFEGINNESLIISDIDGVFFKSIIDPREIFGIINNRNLEIFNRMLSRNAAFWLFTNRNYLFRYFPYIQQLKKSIRKETSKKPFIYPNCLKFLSEYDRTLEYAIIMNANKPRKESQKVVEQGIKNFKKVIYIASKDTPFFYPDEELLNRLDKKYNLSRLTFISIGLFT